MDEPGLEVDGDIVVEAGSLLSVIPPSEATRSPLASGLPHQFTIRTRAPTRVRGGRITAVHKYLYTTERQIRMKLPPPPTRVFTPPTSSPPVQAQMNRTESPEAMNSQEEEVVNVPALAMGLEQTHVDDSVEDHVSMEVNKDEFNPNLRKYRNWR